MPDNRIGSQLLEILACPACHAHLRERENELVCASPACALRYPVREGIPVLLVAEARRTPATEFESRSTNVPSHLD